MIRAIRAGTVCRINVVGLSVIAPKIPAINTQIKKNSARDLSFFSLKADQNKPAAIKLL